MTTDRSGSPTALCVLRKHCLTKGFIDKCVIVQRNRASRAPLDTVLSSTPNFHLCFPIPRLLFLPISLPIPNASANAATATATADCHSCTDGTPPYFFFRGRDFPLAAARASSAADATFFKTGAFLRMSGRTKYLM